MDDIRVEITLSLASPSNNVVYRLNNPSYLEHHENIHYSS